MRIRRRFRTQILACLVLAMLGAPMRAQQPSYQLTLSPGTELRVTPRASNRAVRGRVVVLAGDTLFLREDEGTSRWSLSALQSLEVRGGENKRRGVLIGAGIASGITAVFGGIDLSKGEISRDDFIGTMLGNAFIGGLIGYAFAPKGWERLPLPSRVDGSPR